MANIVKQTAKKLIYGPLSPIASITFRIISNLEYKHFNNNWKKQGRKKPDQSEIDLVRKNVTIIFKSFERQKMAKRLYKNIQSYYPASVLSSLTTVPSRSICRMIHCR